MKKLTKRLLERSEKAFILSLETYNRLITGYRAEAFAILFINAWELLLKAKILDQSGDNNSILYKRQKEEHRKSIGFGNCLKKIFDENDAIRKNLEEIQDLRDSSVHLIVEEIDKIYVGLFQAGVLNYVECLNKWFSVDITNKINPAMLGIVSDVRGLDFIKIKNLYGKEVLEFLKSKQEKINKESLKLKNPKYNITIDYKIALVKNLKKADIVITKGEIGSGRTQGILIEVPKDINKTHPFRSKEVIERVNQKRIFERKITSYDIQAIVYVEKIKKKPEFHYYIPKLTPRLYSERFVDFITKKISKSKNYLVRVRAKYKKYLRKRREENKLKKVKSNNKQKKLTF